MAKTPDQELEWLRGQTLSEEDYRIFKIARVTAKHRSSNRQGVFSVIKSPDWVNVLALTSDNKAVIIRQFRHGTEKNTTEIPGGMVDPGEAPLTAAKRELSEETGYTASHWIRLGTSEPNPAIQDNLCHLFLALDAQKTEERALDPNEVIHVELTPISQLPNLVYNGTIRHSLVLACFAYFQQLSGGWRRPTAKQLQEWTPAGAETITSSEA